MCASEKIVIIDFSKGEVFIDHISKKEDTESFLKRRGFNESEVSWIRGDIIIHKNNEAED